MHQEQTAFENIVGKGEIARNEQFLLFPQCFLLYQISVSPFIHIFDIISLFAVELEDSKIGKSGKKLKTFADDKVDVAQMMISVFDRVENIVRKGENACYQHFLLFQQCFQKAFSSQSLKVWIVWYRVKTFNLPEKENQIVENVL